MEYPLTKKPVKPAHISQPSRPFAKGAKSLNRAGLHNQIKSLSWVNGKVKKTRLGYYEHAMPNSSGLKLKKTHEDYLVQDSAKLSPQYMSKLKSDKDFRVGEYKKAGDIIEKRIRKAAKN